MRKGGSRLFEKLSLDKDYILDFYSRFMAMELYEDKMAIQALLMVDKCSTEITMQSRNCILAYNLMDCLDLVFKRGSCILDLNFISHLFVIMGRRVEQYDSEVRIKWGSFYDIYQRVCHYNELGHFVAGLMLIKELLRLEKFPVVMDYTKLCELNETEFWAEANGYSLAEKKLYNER